MKMTNSVWKAGKFHTAFSHLHHHTRSKVLFSVLHRVKYRITETQDVISHNKQTDNHNQLKIFIQVTKFYVYHRLQYILYM